MRILAVDPGEKRIGLAISDPTGTLARPLAIINHVARAVDAAVIAEQAKAQGVRRIIVGQAMDEEGNPSFQGRRSTRLAEAIRLQTDIPVELWDESTTTLHAKEFRMTMGVSKKKRKAPIDDVAAAFLLQSYLEAQRTLIPPE